MRFHPRLAPIKAGVFPLVNKDGMPEIAEKLYRDMRQQRRPCAVRREAVASASATPAWTRPARRSASRSTARRCTDQTVTVRDRDTGAQERVAADHVVEWVSERVRGDATSA